MSFGAQQSLVQLEEMGGVLQAPHTLSASDQWLNDLWAFPLRMADKDDDDANRDGESGLATKVRPKTKRPSRYRVLLLNDDYTPMEFVVAILKEVFNKDQDAAFQIMMHVHQNGVGQCGVFPYEVAESKVMRVMDAARKNQHPLQCVMEKE